jgi:hypothetical protein
MNEQQLADLFSQQVDPLLRGEPSNLPSPGNEGLQELISLADELSRVQFQASPTAQAAFQSQLENWFGPTSGWKNSGLKYGRWNTMSVKLLTVIVSILVTVTTGAIAVLVAVMVVIRGVIPGAPPVRATATPVPSLTSTPVPSATWTLVPTQTVTSTAVPSRTVAATMDTMDTITVVVTIEIDLEGRFPDLTRGDGDPHDNDDDDRDGDGSSDHNRGHGNDPDHHDEDNPGRGHD